MKELKRRDGTIIFTYNEGEFIKKVEVNRRKLNFANLSFANLSSANLSSANLHSADLHSADLYSADLHSADLHSADLYSADLYFANLSSANLSSADLRFADLSSTNLSSANLSSANLHSADLYSANLSFANLSSADLSYADLSSADLSQVKGLLSFIDYMDNNFEKNKEGYIVYKIFNKYFVPPDNWKIEPGSIISEVVNPIPTNDCASGVNVATLDWCRKENNNEPIWKCIIKWEWSVSIVVPYNTKGKIRCEKVKLLELI